MYYKDVNQPVKKDDVENYKEDIVVQKEILIIKNEMKNLEKLWE